MLKEKKNSWNNLNDSTSQSSKKVQLSKTNLSSQTQEQPIYIFPPNTDYPEDDFHQFYYPSDFPNHSHLQIVCSYFRLGPPYSLLTASLEHYEHQKSYPDQRPLENDLKNDPDFMSLLSKYADFYIDYDLQDPDNIASKQYLFINPHTKRVTKRKPAARKTSKASSRYNNANFHYIKKNFAQQSSSKIVLRTTPAPPIATQNSGF